MNESISSRYLIRFSALLEACILAASFFLESKNQFFNSQYTHNTGFRHSVRATVSNCVQMDMVSDIVCTVNRANTVTTSKGNLSLFAISLIGRY